MNKGKLLGLTLSALIPVFSLAGSSIAQSDLFQAVNAGPRDKRINIVFLSEAYTSTQRLQYYADAANAVAHMFANSPFDEYESYFNIFYIWVPSNEEGADHPPDNIFRDTYFNSTYDSYGIQRLITIPPNDYDFIYANGAGKVAALLAEHVPEYDVVGIIVNDPVYGGSGGTFALSSTHSSSPEIVLHEMGHTYAYLGDEYETPYPGYPDIEEPNTTQETTRELIKWNPWILPSTPVQTPETSTYADVVGLFEGAHYHALDWFRPKLNCKMRTLGPAFCEVCREQLVLGHYRMLSTIDSVFPATAIVPLVGDQIESFRVVPNVPVSHNLLIEWFVDGEVAVGANSDEFSISGGDLGDGNHQLSVTVTDTTAFVIIDPTSMLVDSQAWDVPVSGIGCCLGIRGNANNDPEDLVNIADITFIVNYLFGIPGGPAPDCIEEANANNDPEELANIADITFLVNYLFGIPGGPAPPPCFEITP